MKIVIDTNVFIAAFISPRGKSSEVMERCFTLHEVVCSEFILNEFRDKMLGKFKREPSDVAEAISLLRARLIMVTPAELSKAASRDTKDDPILGTAIAGQAEQIITGDKDLLSLASFGTIRIVNPTVFFDEDQTLE